MTENQTLDITLKYLNEGNLDKRIINIKKFKEKFLKNKKNRNVTINKKEETEVKNVEKQIVDTINKIITKLKSQSAFKAKIKEESDKYLKEVIEADIYDNEDELYNDPDLDEEDIKLLKIGRHRLTKQDKEDAKFPEFKCKVFENLKCEYEYKNELYFFGILEILGGTQMQCCIHSWALPEVISVLEKTNPKLYSEFKFDYGDGDEGCLYIQFKMKRIQE